MRPRLHRPSPSLEPSPRFSNVRDKAAEVREARRQRIEAEEERLDFLDVCFDLLDAIEAYNDVLGVSAEADEEEVSGSAFAFALQTEP